MLSSNDFKTVSSPLILSRTHRWHPVRTGDDVSILNLWDERMDCCLYSFISHNDDNPSSLMNPIVITPVEHTHSASREQYS